MPKPIEFFSRLPLRGGSKIVRAFRHDELSDWMWHGNAFSDPFADVSRRSRRWIVSHIRCGHSLSGKTGNRLSFKEASRIAAAMDEAFQGWGQVDHRLKPNGEGEIVGWLGEPKEIAIRTLDALGYAGTRP